ncbi:MAG TPA: hypothetical protein VEC06_09490 [Paucimonas sp.]|nr:hypothetical protein [Paucimonas sp.]
MATARLRHAFLLLSACATASVAGAAAPGYANRHDALVAYSVPVAPWTFPEQPTRGIAPEFLGHLFDAADVDIKIGTLPYVRAIHGLRDGSNVGTLLIPDAERDMFALRLCEVAQIRSGLLYKKSRFTALTPKDLPGLTVGMQRGTRALEKLEQIPGLKRHTIESVGQGLKMLQVDRLDATFLSSPGSESMLRESGLAPDDYGWLEVDAAPVVVYISRKSPLAQDAPAMQRLKAACEGSGAALMKELMRKYR